MLKKPLVTFILLAAVLAGGVYYWAQNLDTDPPMYYSGLGQSLSTDPAHYVYHARNKVLFDDFNPFDDPRWTVFQHSLVSLTSLVIFEFYGVSVTTSNIVGMVLSLLGLLFILAALYKKHKNWVLLLTAVLYLSNYTLYTYARLPFLENGLIFIASLLFFTISRWSNKTYGLIISGVLTSFAMLTGKMFGAVFAPVIILLIFFSETENKVKKIALYISSFAASLFIIAYSLYGSNISSAFGYVSEQSYGLRGFPEGLTTPWGFIEHLISYGADNRLFYNNLDLLMILLLSAFIISFFKFKGNSIKNLPVTTRFSFFWIICGLLLLMPLNYSPLRYAVFIIPPIFILGGTTFELMLASPRAKRDISNIKNLIPLMIVLWMFLFHFIVLLFYKNSPPTRILVWSLLPAAVLIVFLFAKFLGRTIQYCSIKTRYAIISTAVILILISNFNQQFNQDYKEDNRTITEAANDLEMILGPHAVLSGSYAPLLTLDSRYKVLIHQFGLKDTPTDLFDKYPVTHIAIDVSAKVMASNIFPQLKDISPTATYWIRDYEVNIYKIADLFANAEANQYIETSYERANRYYINGKPDSAYYALEPFILSNPNSKSANLLMGNVLINLGEFQRGMMILTSLADKYPTDSYLNLHCGKMIHLIGATTKDETLIRLSQRYYEQAVKANPYRGDYANNIYAEIMRKYTHL